MMNILQLLMNSKNPQQLAINMLQQSMPNNPMTNNLMQMIQSGDKGAIEMFARNLCKEKGIDPEQAINDLKNIYKR